MNLVFVTFEIDFTQFLVNANNDVDPIEEAIRANIQIGGFEDDPDDGLTLEEVKNKANYTVIDVEDMMDLYMIIRRTDWHGIYGNTIVFSN